MSYDPKGKSFTYDGVQYCLGVAAFRLNKQPRLPHAR